MRCKPASGAGDTRLNFVCNHNDAVCLRPSRKCWQESWGRHNEATLTLDWLDDNRREVSRADALLHVVDGALGSVFAADATIAKRVRHRHVVHARSERPKAAVVRHCLEVHGHGQVGAPVVSVIKNGNFAATGELASKFDGVFYSLRTRVE